VVLVAHMESEKCIRFVRKLSGGRRHWWKDNIQMEFITHSQDRAFVDTVVNLRFP
jgi:hypothetical protein